MGVTERHIVWLCNAASGKFSNKRDWGLPPLMELIYIIEQKPYPYYPYYPSPEAAKADFIKWWDEKYSKCVCNMGPAQSSTLDAIALYNEQDNWVFSLYNPNGAFRADINRIMYLSYHINKKGTLPDYMDFILEGNFYKLRDDSGFRTDSFPGLRDRVIRMGGKRMSELE